MERNIYRGAFDNWESVTSNFEIKEPEPQTVFIATYGEGAYEGDAVVVYRNGNDYFVADGSHCSCYGLEGQWNPEKYDRATLLSVIDKKLETLKNDSESPSYDRATWVFIKQQIENESPDRHEVCAVYERKDGV